MIGRDDLAVGKCRSEAEKAFVGYFRCLKLKVAESGESTKVRETGVADLRLVNVQMFVGELSAMDEVQPSQSLCSNVDCSRAFKTSCREAAPHSKK